MKCRTHGCEGRVEGAAKLWLNLAEDGSWSVYGVADEAASIAWDDAGHDNYSPELGESMSAYIETLLPGFTWAGSAEGVSV